MPLPHDALTTLTALAHDPAFDDRLAFARTLPARDARFAEPARPLHPVVETRLHARGIDRLWTHQAEVIDLLRDGKHVAIATGTASGKSLCYQVPIAEAVARGGGGSAGRRRRSRSSTTATNGDEEAATALLIFPTKALAQDQLRALREWLLPGLVAATYDGDTPPDERARVRKHANVVLTNPEMLHVGMLPYHQRWATFLMRLRYVVVDELHTLRGIFGSHVAHVLRRLRRMCAHYGSEPSFCFASATIGNPGELASALCGLPVQHVTNDGAPRGERVLACWQRPMLDEHSGVRASANVEVASLLSRFVGAGHQTLAFTRSRKATELIAAQARRILTDRNVGGGAVPQVAAYRAGYLPEERRALEQALTSGELAGIVATNALELGIDIGGLDTIILNGFPGTLASMWQQAGRAGRTGGRAAAVLVCGDDQLDQWYARHPDELLSRPPETAVVNPGNPFVMRPQVACAAHELPLTPGDEAYFGSGLDDAVRELVMADLLKPRDGRMFWSDQKPPAPDVGLRSGSTIEYELVATDGDVIGTVDGSRVYQVAHPGAVYLHQGRQYQVERLDTHQHRAVLVPADDIDEYTQTRETTDLSIVEEELLVPVGPGVAHLGAVEVTSRVTAYQRKRSSTNEVIGVVDLDLPPETLHTRACWYTVPMQALGRAGIEPVRVLGTVHAAEHALIGLLPLFTICDRWDVGGVSMALHPATGDPTIFVYDGYPGGAGIAELAFDRLHEHLAAAHELIATCPCDDGCPSCVQSPKCGNWNEWLDKDGAARLLALLAVQPPPST